MTAARYLAAFAALGLVFFTATASARSLRYPQSGDPAFSMEVPEDWSSRTDNSGNFIVVSGDRAIAYSMNVFVVRASADEVARNALEVRKVTPVPEKQRVSISGSEGVAYKWKASNATNAKLDITLMVVQVDATHVANCTEILVESGSPEAHQIAKWFVQDLQISRPAH